ncbi:hypothetical protein [Candidatus Uabimicrobium sp. HlEnr_7]|uniref:hypothetical protein n=1 Tax=Candidatus Uabimicrobium helgolandensis TaxID=3095367 RepID=UPI0035573036
MKNSRRKSAIANYKEKSQKDQKKYIVIVMALSLLLLLGKISIGYSLPYMIVFTLVSVGYFFSEISTEKTSTKKRTFIEDDVIEEREENLFDNTRRKDSTQF